MLMPLGSIKPNHLYREALVESIDELFQIRSTDVGICLWKRQQIPEITNWCNLISKSCNLDLDEIISTEPDQLSANVSIIVQKFPDSPHNKAIVDDLTMLLTQFSFLTEAKRVRVRFGVVRTDECRKFHVDAVSVRLFCTYQGPGTQWIRDQDLDWENLGKNIECVDEYNAAILKPKESIQMLGPFEVALAKGAGWPGSEKAGVVHRSPPLENLGLSRIRLIVDVR